MTEDSTAAPPPRVLSFDSRTVRAMLPHRKHMALLDRVESYSSQQRMLVGVKEVAQNEPVFEGHFPDDPVFPGPLIIEALAQGCGVMMNIEYMMGNGVRLDRLADRDFLASVPPLPLTVL